jgi:nucleoside 2-deoxyribosyltransferase
MRVYVAGSSAEREAVAEDIRRLEASGITVTYDWTKSPGWSRTLSQQECIEQARTDLDAVRDADVFWLRLGEKSEGAHAELGYAVALHKYVLVSGEITPGRIFPLLADFRFDAHEEALEVLCRIREAFRVAQAIVDVALGDAPSDEEIARAKATLAKAEAVEKAGS